MNRFTGKTIDRRIEKILAGRTDMRAIYTWVKEGRINADEFAYIMQKLIEAKAPPKKPDPYVIFADKGMP